MTGRRARSPSPLWLVAPAAAAPLLLAAPNPFWRAAAGLFVVALLPGYLLLEFLSTYRPLEPHLRVVLVVPAGLALAIPLLLALDYGGLYHHRLALALLVLLEEGLALAWLWRGRRSPPPVIRLPLPRRGGSVVLLISILAFLGAVAYAAATPRRVVPLTEFYLLGPDGRLPLVIPAGDHPPPVLSVVIANHEGRLVRYRLVVSGSAAGHEIPLGATQLTLAAGNSWQEDRPLPSAVPLDTVTFSLFKDGSALPHRQLWVAVERFSVEDLHDSRNHDGDEHDRQWHDRHP
jgi:uncharacterized membrane protein